VNLGPCVIPNPILSLCPCRVLAWVAGLLALPIIVLFRWNFHRRWFLSQRLFGDVSLASPEGASGPVLVLPCVKPIVQPLQRVVVVSTTANLDVRQAGSSSMRTYIAGGPFLLLPNGLLGAQTSPEGVLVTTITSVDIRQAGSPSPRYVPASGPIAQSFPAMGSSLGVTRVTGHDSFKGFWAKFELVESSSTSMVPDSGDKLGSQDKVGFDAHDPCIVSPGLLFVLASS